MRLVERALADKLNVVILCRRNVVPGDVKWDVNGRGQAGDGNELIRYRDLIRSFFPEDVKEQISISTTHKYKGLERSMVIVRVLAVRRRDREQPFAYPPLMSYIIFTEALNEIGNSI